MSVWGVREAGSCLGEDGSASSFESFERTAIEAKGSIMSAEERTLEYVMVTIPTAVGKQAAAGAAIHAIAVAVAVAVVAGPAAAILL